MFTSNRKYHSNSYEQPMDDMSCIIDNGSMGSVYLGNIESASDSENLRRHKIKGVLSICMNKIPYEIQSALPHHLHIYLEDSEQENIARHFEQSNQFIEKARQSGNVLVHCMAGISRSATLVAAYLMKYHKMSAQNAINLLERKRWQVYPNNGFLRQLNQYERVLAQQVNGNDILSSPLRESWGNKPFQTPVKEISFMNKHEDKQQSGQKTRPLDDICFDSYKRKSFCNNHSTSPEQKAKQPFSLTQQKPTTSILTSPDYVKKKNYLQETINGNKKDGLAALALELNSLDWQNRKQDFENKYSKQATLPNQPTKSFLSTRPFQLNSHQSKLDELLNSFNKKPIL